LSKCDAGSVFKLTQYFAVDQRTSVSIVCIHTRNKLARNGSASEAQQIDDRD